MDRLVNQGHDPIENLLTRPVVLELDALTQSDKVFVAQALLLWIHHYRMTEPTRETFKNAIVIEEAHHILSGERHSLVGGQSVMEIAFREIREFGVSIVLLDQMPSTISTPALANTSTAICFNVKHRADVSAMSQAMLLEEQEKNLLGSLQVGEAVVRLQGRSVRPFMIRVPEFMIHKGDFSDVKVIQHMRRLGLLSARKVEPRPPATAPCTSSCQTHSHTVVPARLPAFTPSPDAPIGPAIAFLCDVANSPDSGIAERYRRLGLSVRQGQKQKETLVARQLIEERVETTIRGKIRMIRLTEQGRLALEQKADTRSEAA